MSDKNAIVEEAGNTLELVSTVQADISKQPENNNPELQTALLKLKELAAQLEEAIATRQ